MESAEGQAGGGRGRSGHGGGGVDVGHGLESEMGRIFASGFYAGITNINSVFDSYYQYLIRLFIII
jgi:hypothetical protein